MTFSERERFIYHAATLMPMKIISKEYKMPTIDIHKMLSLIKNNRCRRLSDKHIESIYDDVEEEVMAANAVYTLGDGEIFSH